jgi:hypothetical protein
MRYSIGDIARLITEDPDILERSERDVLIENTVGPGAFKKSDVPYYQSKPRDPSDDGSPGVPGWEMVYDGKAQEGERQEPLKLRHLQRDQKIELIQRIRAVVDPALVKYEQYFVVQVARGFLTFRRIEEDAERLNETIRKFIKHSRKAYWKKNNLSANIMDHPDWRKLEQLILKIEEENIEYDGDEGTLFSKAYVNNVMSLLFGDPPEVTKYWFRKIDDYEASKKYGCGTQWCTVGSRNMFDQYHGGEGGDGLYIFEVQTPTMARKPIFQLSGEEKMDNTDTPVSRFGPRFADFANEVLARFGSELPENTLETLKNLATPD